MLGNHPRIQEIIDTIPGLVFTTDAAGVTDFINRQLLNYFGRSLGELKGWMAGNTIHPDDAGRVGSHWKRAIALGTASEIELRLRRADGVYRWFHYRAVPLHDARGHIDRWYVLASDIEDLKQAQEKLRASESHLRLLVDSIPGLVYTRDARGELEFVNRPLLEFFGRPPEEMRQWRTNDLIHPDDRERTVATLSEGIEAGQPTEIEIRVRRADGVYRWCHFRQVPSHDAQGQLDRWYCLVTDIDDRKRAEETLRATQARLSQAMHMASLSELSASIAHEINQPLAAVVANGHACRRWLSSEPPNIDRAAASADRIIRDGNIAAEIIQRIRSLFTRAPPSKDLLNVNDVVADVCALLAHELHAKSIVLKADLQIDMPPVAADRIQLQQVVANLVRNGAEAMESVTGRERRLSICSRASKEEIIVEIADSGVGIDNPEAIYEPFYTTKPHGMGMGLAICRSVIDAHGGRLWASPNEPQGARFGFALRNSIETVSQ